MAYVGGRGHGKVTMQHAVLEEQRRRAGELMADWAEEALDVELLPWQKDILHSMSFRRGILGQFSMGYTPAEELRDRLNDRLQGKEPVAVINTRYWRNL